MQTNGFMHRSCGKWQISYSYIRCIDITYKEGGSQDYLELCVVDLTASDCYICLGIVVLLTSLIYKEGGSQDYLELCVVDLEEMVNY